jgi:hypothetical protein
MLSFVKSQKNLPRKRNSGIFQNSPQKNHFPGLVPVKHPRFFRGEYTTIEQTQTNTTKQP